MAIAEEGLQADYGANIGKVILSSDANSLKARAAAMAAAGSDARICLLYTSIAGMGELHLEIIVDRLLREFKVEANVGAPQVAYKETFTKAVDVDSKYAKQSGGRGQYGHCKVKFEPMDANGEELFKFESTVVGGAIPKEYIPAVGEGIEEAMKAGILGGFPVVGVHANVYDGSYHEVDSSEMAFHIAGSLAFKDAMAKALSLIHI